MTQNFELQRTTVEQTQLSIQRILDAHQEAIHQFSESTAQWSEFSGQNVDFTRQFVHAYFDAIETGLPEDDVDLDAFEQFVDEQLDTVSDAQEKAVAALVKNVEQSAEIYDESLEAYTNAVDSSFDTFLEAHEHVEAGVSDATGEFSA